MILCISLFALLLCALGTGQALAKTEGTWAFSEEITVRENSGNNLSSYPVLITLGPSDFNFSKAEPDGSDIRFLKNGRALDYWIKDWDSEAEHAELWVRIPLLSANEDSKLQMKYGNPEAESESDGKAVFDFFDDFEEDSLNSFNWKSKDGGEGFVEIKNGVCKLMAPEVHVNDFALIYSRDSFDINSVFEVKRMKVTTGEDARGPVQRQGFIDQLDKLRSKIWHETELANESKVRWEVVTKNDRFRSFDLTDVRVPEGEWYESAIAWYEENDTRKVAWFKNGARVSAMDYDSIEFVPFQAMHIYLYAASYPDASENTGYMAVDYALVRKFVSEEPTVWVGEIPPELETAGPVESSTPEPSGPAIYSPPVKADENRTGKEQNDSEGMVSLNLNFSGMRFSSPDDFELSVLTEELKATGVNVVFLSVDPENIWQYERFLKSAHTENLMVYAVLLEAPDCNSSKGMADSLAAVDTVLDYNKKSLAGFDGICIYVESSQDPESDEGCMDYVALLEAVNDLNEDIPLSVSLPPRYADSKIRELSPFLDFFVLRAYGETSEKLNVLPLIVDAVAPKMGEIRGTGSKGVVEIKVNGAFNDKKEVEKVFSSLATYYSEDPAFLGLSVSDYAAYSTLPVEAEEEAPEPSKPKPSIPGFELGFALLGLGIFSLIGMRKK
ncbi:MAG: DUF2341 domain-containing protein [Methanosarcinaceae archaeon]|nr:DUF2341 domain-containing protein [Methanosarcinaceae archaeon]